MILFALNSLSMPFRDTGLSTSRRTLQDELFRQAAGVGVGQAMCEIERYMDANARGTAVVLDVLASEGHQVRKEIVASSMSIYGEGEYRCPERGVVYPGRWSNEQLGARDWEVRCPVIRSHASRVSSPQPATGTITH